LGGKSAAIVADDAARFELTDLKAIFLHPRHVKGAGRIGFGDLAGFPTSRLRFSMEGHDRSAARGSFDG
jgi:hypothetical protein